MTLATVLPTHAQSWQIHDVGSGGGKPSLAVDASGNPHIVYMRETSDGYIRHAVWNQDNLSFDVEKAVSGYFFGPAALAIDPGGRPHVNYHDHATGDQQHVYLTDQGWINEPIRSSGHDGWDNSMAIDRRGVVHTSSTDPSAAGVEYAYSTSIGWTVEAIGSNRINYGYGTSLAVDSLGIPHIAYFDNFTIDLKLASRTSGWVISTVDTVGDAGRFPSLKVDAQGGKHVSYLRDLGGGRGLIEYAYHDGTEWSYSTVDKLDDVTASVAGYITSLDLDSEGNPHVAYGDRKRVKYAYKSAELWIRESVVDVRGTETELGQIVSLDLDATDTPHLAYSEVISRGIEGNVKYAKRASAPVSVETGTKPEPVEALYIYPNPASSRTQISFVLNRRSETSLTVYNVLGRTVRSWEGTHRSAGRHSIRFDSGTLAGGLYVVSLNVGERSLQQSLLVVR